MATLYISADALKPSNHAVEQAYYFGSDVPFGPPILIDTGDGEQASLAASSNTFPTFAIGSSLYKLVTRQGVFVTLFAKSTDDGATWAVLDAANAPAFQCCSGYFDLNTNKSICAYIDVNGGGTGHIKIVDFDHTTDLWDTPDVSVGSPAVVNPGSSIAIWGRSDGTFVVIYKGRDGFGAGAVTGLSAVVYDRASLTFGAPIDLGAGITALLGWDSTQTSVLPISFRGMLDASDILHCFFRTQSVETVPVIWGNRVFYQQFKADDTLGAFFDFPGQVQPLPAFPYNRQQLNAFTGPPYGNPIIIGGNLILPVLMRNDSTLDRFPVEVPNVYVGTPVAAPIWTLVTGGGVAPPSTIDPGVIVDDFIWAQEAPSLTYDGTTMYAVYSAQDEDGQNLARLRLVQSTNIADPADAASWTGQTVFDLQVDASPPGFQFATQQLSGAGALAPIAAAPAGVPVNYIDAAGVIVVALPNPAKECVLV